MRYLGTLLALVVACALPFLGASAAEPQPPPREMMQRVFAAMTVLLPLSLDEKTFMAPANQPEIARQIAILSGAVHEIEAHGERRDPSFRFLSRSLATDVEEINQRYRWGRLDEARYFVLESTRNCVACHTRLPSARKFPLGERLIEQVDASELSHHERSQILVATRQFDQAMSNWEELFESGSMLPSQFHLGGYLNDYLVVAVRVQNDLPRARKTLEKLAKLPDTPAYLQQRVAAWIRELAEFEQLSSLPPDLESVRALMRRSRPQQDVADDQATAVADLLASRILFTYIDSAAAEGIPESTLAEAFYLLGAVEARGADSFWVPQAEFHLEAAIRLDPSGPFARRAFDLLEQSLAVGFGGTDSEILPMDLWVTLSELRALVDPSSRSPKP